MGQYTRSTYTKQKVFFAHQQQVERKIADTLSFIPASKEIKYLQVNLIK